jgi:hypothetical protein
MQLVLPWPDHIPCSALRGWIRQQLARHGEPLRWSITAVESVDQTRQLRLEAVVLQ